MNIKNYTSTVPAMTSMGRIENLLIEVGATGISKKIDPATKTCTAITFKMELNGMPLSFHISAQIQPCFDVLWAEVKRPRPDTKQLITQQAERTAWKIISDWVEIQVTMIRLQQAELLQVFLPYLYDEKNDQTFYNRLQEGGFKLLTNQ